MSNTRVGGISTFRGGSVQRTTTRRDAGRRSSRCADNPDDWRLFRATEEEQSNFSQTDSRSAGHGIPCLLCSQQPATEPNDELD